MVFFPNIKVEQLDKIFLAFVSIFSSRDVDNMPIYNDKNALAKTEIGPPTYILFGEKGSRMFYKFSKNSLPSYERSKGLSESSWICRQNCCKLTAVSVLYLP